MESQQRLYNGRFILADSVISGSLVMAGDSIVDINEGQAYSRGIDCENDFLLPGLIELHTDNLEKYCVPRPGIYWPSMSAALIAHDNQVFNAGITTVLDAVALGFTDERNFRCKILDASVATIQYAQENKLIRADHYLHFRCELPSTTVFDSLASYADSPLLRLVSVMDHTPGQRQWRDLPKWRLYHSDKKWTDDDAQAVIDERKKLQQSHADMNRRNILALCQAIGVPAASHDDTLAEHCRTAWDDGITISEFPTTMEAARQARELGMKVIMGAPNMVRGQSHSGNVSSHELAEDKLIDGFSSDYMPVSLLHSAFILHQQFGYPLPDAIATVTSNIAKMLNLEDRGTLAPGKKADILRVRLEDGLPVVKAIWKNGKMILGS